MNKMPILSCLISLTILSIADDKDKQHELKNAIFFCIFNSLKNKDKYYKSKR